MRPSEVPTAGPNGIALRLLCCFLVAALFIPDAALALPALLSSTPPGAVLTTSARPVPSNAGLENAHRGISALLVRFALLRCAGEAWNHALSRACVYGGPPWFVVHRYYDPALGRYLTRDPLGDGMNPYVYVGANPLSLTDPMGLCVAQVYSLYSVVGAITGAVAGAGALTAGGAIALVAAVAGLSDVLFTWGLNVAYDLDMSPMASEALQEHLGIPRWLADLAEDLALGGAAAKAGKVAGAAAAGEAERGVFSVGPYLPRVPGLPGHHGVMDAWARNNIPGYVARAAKSPVVRLTPAQHASANAVYADWLFERTGRRVGVSVDWSQVSPREIQSLAYRMFDAAGVPAATQAEYFRAFNQYIYGLAQ